MKVQVISTRNTLMTEEPFTIMRYKEARKDRIKYRCKRCNNEQKGYIKYHKEYPVSYPKFCQYCGSKLFKLEETNNE